MSDIGTPQSEPVAVEEQFMNLNGKQYPLSQLPPDIRDLINIHQSWEKELVEQRVAVFKTEAAIKALATEVAARTEKLEADIAAAKAAEEAPKAKTKAKRVK